MALIRQFAKPEADPGKWFEFGPDPEVPGRVVRFCVRRLAPSVARELRPRKDQLPFRKGAALLTIDHEKEESVRQAAATWAWVAAENLYITALDEEQAKKYSELLGGVPVEVGREVCIDGQLNAQLQMHLCEAWPELVKWILERSDELALQGKEREGDLRGN